MVFVCPGTDPTEYIQDFANSTNNTLQIIALGQGEFLKVRK